MMSTTNRPLPNALDSKINVQLRSLADQAFSRAAGAPLVPGNSVRLLKDATENYPAWLEAIASATRRIHFENYIIHSDDIGEQFADALASKARKGVHVRLIYDWFGALAATSRRFWKSLRLAGVEVRCFNPPHLDSPFGWLSRDHRKMLAVDGRVAFVTGLCVGHDWAGDTARGIEPWRDTGIEIEGPAVADVEQSFAMMWATLGSPVPPEEIPQAGEPLPGGGDVPLRIVASVPNLAGLYRLDQLIAAIARRSIWLADAYFVGTAAYVEALKAAAMDGVDVRLLVPRANDIPLMRAVSRAGFRGLLEAGVRIFEWNGPMMHAKTAVADGRWARVGSTNLNVASWIGNWELDVVAEEEEFSKKMQSMFLQDLAHSTEIVLKEKRTVRPTTTQPSNKPKFGTPTGSAGRAATSVLRIGNAVGAAITDHRTLGPAEAKIMFGVGCFLLMMTAIVIFWPRLLVIPVVVLGGWLGISLLVRAQRLRAGRDS
ncbi:MAG TPA: phospholipase D-like domain-containing protein [Candidatus Aquilonibacter sp.]|nr:phospholipase D-like domain-containing protein [Candidatus Aquilonibacter sp.]